MEPIYPFPEEVIKRLLQSPAQAFSHDVVMDAIDVSMAIDRHLLIYGIEGLFQIDTDIATWRLPPSRAAWIPAGRFGRASTIKMVRCISVFVEPSFVTSMPTENQVFNATLLIREMFKYSLRWTDERHPDDPSANRFFLTLMDLIRQEMQTSDLYALPKAQSDDMREVLAYTSSHLDTDIHLEDVAKLAAMSPRTLTRHLQAEIYMTWGQYLQQVRMLKAMDYLAEGKTVTITALEVGYSNMSAFSTAFLKYTELTPTQYQSQFT